MIKIRDQPILSSWYNTKAPLKAPVISPNLFRGCTRAVHRCSGRRTLSRGCKRLDIAPTRHLHGRQIVYEQHRPAIKQCCRTRSINIKHIFDWRKSLMTKTCKNCGYVWVDLSIKQCPRCGTWYGHHPCRTLAKYIRRFKSCSTPNH